MGKNIMTETYLNNSYKVEKFLPLLPVKQFYTVSGIYCLINRVSATFSLLAMTTTI